jgi:hypothetical protein
VKVTALTIKVRADFFCFFPGIQPVNDRKTDLPDFLYQVDSRILMHSDPSFCVAKGEDAPKGVGAPGR